MSHGRWQCEGTTVREISVKFILGDFSPGMHYKTTHRAYIMWDETGQLFIVIPGSHRIIPQLLLLKNRTTKSRSHKINSLHTQLGARLHSTHNSKHTRCIPAKPIPSYLADPARSRATGGPRQLLPQKRCHKAPNLNPQIAEFMRQQQNLQPSSSVSAVCAVAARPRGGVTPRRWRRTGAVSARGRGTRGRCKTPTPSSSQALAAAEVTRLCSCHGSKSLKISPLRDPQTPYCCFSI